MVTKRTNALPESAAIPLQSFANGVVTNVNGNGLQLHGHESWYNVSKFASKNVVLPAIGEAVTLNLDAAGFIRGIRVDTAPSKAPSREAAMQRIEAQLGPSTREFRLSCLKLAFEAATLGMTSDTTLRDCQLRADVLATWATTGKHASEG